MSEPSNFTQAVGPIKEHDLRCPNCPAMNRVGATYIELQPNGCAYCSVCSKSFDPRSPHS